MRPARFIGGGIALGAALAVAAWSLAAGEEPGGKTTVVTTVHVDRLVAQWGVAITGETEFGVSSLPVVLMYSLGDRDHGPLGSMGVGVSQSSDEASHAFGRILGVPAVAPTWGGQDAPGDEFVYWVRAGRDVTHILLRRDNVVVSSSWKGSSDEALAFARRIDELLLTDPEIAPRGEQVVLPTLEITVPDFVVAGKEAKLTIQVTEGGPVRVVGQAYYREEHDRARYAYLRGAYTPFTEAKVSVELPEPGTYSLELRFATEGNVFFTRTCEVKVIAEGDLPASVPRPWDIFGETLYFLRSPDQDWGAQKQRDLEWLEYARGTFGRIPDEEKWTRKGLDDLAAVMQERWLPSLELLHAAEHHTRPAQIVYYASVRIQDYGIIYMGVPDRQLFVYLEQPEPLPQGARQLTAADVLKDDLLRPETNEQGETTYPRAQFMVRKLHRYRAVTEKGPYEPVNILLIDLRLADQVNLRDPGFP